MQAAACGFVDDAVPATSVISQYYPGFFLAGANVSINTYLPRSPTARRPLAGVLGR
jgi:hypothetical protein